VAEVDAAIAEACRLHAGKRGTLDGEDERILSALFEVTQTQGDHFERAGYSGNIPAPCYGWRKGDDFGFTSTGLQKATGFETRQVSKCLVKHGWIEAGADGRASRNSRIDGGQQRFYWIKAEVLETYDTERNG
jgi:hypothetical protein